MSELIRGNPSLLIRLAASSIALSTAVAKFVSNYKQTNAAKAKDADHYELLKSAYIETSEEEVAFSEIFAHVSAEVDRLLLELKAPR